MIYPGHREVNTKVVQLIICAEIGIVNFLLQISRCTKLSSFFVFQNKIALISQNLFKAMLNYKVIVKIAARMVRALGCTLALL